MTGALEGERFDVDEAATGSAAPGALVLTLQDGSFSTRQAIAGGALAGARIVVRPHVTLGMLTGMFTPGLTGHDNPLRADGVWLFENDSLAFYHLRGDGVRWARLGGNQDQSARIISPDISVVIDLKSRAQSWLHEGRVRTNAFRKNLKAGLQAFSSGFPVNLSPAQLGAFVNPAQPAATRWTGSNNLLLADQIHVLFGEASPLADLLPARGWRDVADAVESGQRREPADRRRDGDGGDSTGQGRPVVSSAGSVLTVCGCGRVYWLWPFSPRP